MDDKVIKLFEGDKRCEALLDAIIDLIYERGMGIPLPSIIGVIDLAKMYILSEQASDELFNN